MNTSTINWTRINNDVNGNPRYVCHYLHLNTEEEKARDVLFSKYDWAVARAKKIGGKCFHNKQYGGGIVFQSYNLKDTEKHIMRVLQEG